MIKTVTAGQSYQAALDEAARTTSIDVIELEAGATFESNFVLPVKAGERMVVTRSTRHAEIPPGRITPDKEPLLPRVITPNVGPVLQAPVGRGHWGFDGVLFSQGAIPIDNAVGYAWSYNLIELGEGDTAGNQKTLADVPHHFDFDRCIVRTRDANTMTQRGITLNSAHTNVRRCHFADIKWPGQETHCLGGWNGPGPFVIEDDFLEAAGINILFGGATPAIPNLIPSDISIRKCFITKKLSWIGKGYTVKNFFELKNARRVLFAENECENTWPDGQVGWAVIFNTFRDGGWEVVEDVRLVSNLFRDSTNGINLSGMDSDGVLRMRRVLVADNVLEGLGFHGTEAKAFQVLNASEDLTIEHNTVKNATHSMTMQSAPGFSHVRLKFINNIVPHGDYGIFSDGGALGMDAMAQRATNWQMEKNAFIAVPAWGDKAKYPGNYFPGTSDEAKTLLGTDGTPVGARTGVVPAPTPTPIPTPTPTPTPTPQPVSPVPKPPSPDGTKANTIVDSSGGEWTLGPNGQTLRNGIHMGSGTGSIYKYLGGVVYVLGNDAWYRWADTFWTRHSATEPGVTPPAPTPVPSPVLETRRVVWPRQEGKQKTVLDQQWAERFRLKDTNLSGDFALFEKVL